MKGTAMKFKNAFKNEIIRKSSRAAVLTTAIGVGSGLLGALGAAAGTHIVRRYTESGWVHFAAFCGGVAGAYLGLQEAYDILAAEDDKAEDLSTLVN